MIDRSLEIVKFVTKRQIGIIISTVLTFESTRDDLVTICQQYAVLAVWVRVTVRQSVFL